jgi:hypothetical protein
VRQSCPAAQYCGGDSCAASIPCDPACPSGYACQPSGICAGGKPDGLILNVQTVHLAGKVTLNGAAPNLDPMCAGNPNFVSARIRLVEAKRGYTYNFTTLCKDSSFSFAGDVFPGTYAVSVDGTNAYSDLPAAAYVASAGLVLDKDTSGQVFDVTTLHFGGSVTLNGKAPALDPLCAGNPGYVTARIQLSDAAHGYRFSFSTLCKDNTFAFSGTIFPGTYTVTVDGTNAYSDLPGAVYVASTGLVISKDSAGTVFDVQTVHVSGQVQLNGKAPMLDPLCAGNPGYITARVQLSDAAHGYRFSFSTLCKDNTFAFAGDIFPGTYTANVDGTNAYSDLPGASFQARTGLAVSKDLSGLLLNVQTVHISGKVTLNGAAPNLDPMCAGNPSYVTARIRMTDAMHGYDYSLTTLCKDSSFSFAADVFPGTYAVRVDGTNAYSDLPGASFLTDSALAVAADLGGLTLAVRTVQLSGKVTLNGAPPTPDAMCAGNPGYVTAHVRLIEPTRGYQFSFNTLCKDNAFGYGGTVFPGNYRVTVDGNSTYSNVPVVAYVANPGLAVTTDVSDVVLDVRTLHVSGIVTLNGAAPMLDAMCAGNPSYVTTHVALTDASRGYTFSFNTLCKDKTFPFAGDIYPGTYAATVDGTNTYSDVPAATYVAIGKIQLP